MILNARSGLVFMAVSLVSMLLASSACETRAPVVVERDLPEIRPNLPAIPNVPPPRHPIQYDDGTWSVYGLRKRIDQVMEEEVRVKAFVVKLYEPVECPEGRTCPPPPMPHLWLGDDSDETKERRLVRLVGYANSQDDIIKAREDFEKGVQPDEEALAAGIKTIWDWQVGKRYIIKGRFARSSGTGFMYSEGLLEYMDHECLDCPPPEENDSKARKSR
jgi:hypothetical protein